ncbi:MAG TPA: hypothetical protein VEO53_14740, partial [Candidatus Binatia bacterium]|nr:hypothetical protein [Candidatus Binatia bacterium]
MIRRLASVILLCLAVAAASAPARAAGVVEPAPDGARFLFIVDMSSSMEYLQSAIEATIYELIGSGLAGQMRVGDTYGVWTFNKETYAGRTPMRVWDPRKCVQLGTIAAAFLNNQPYEKSSNLKQTISTLAGVIRAVSNLTVFIISDGGSPMRGTPFDNTVNADYKKKSRDRSQAKRPFVTTLVVRDGWFVSAAVSIGGQPIPLPDRPPPLLTQTTKSPPPERAVPNDVVLRASTGTTTTQAPPPAKPATTAPQVQTAGTSSKVPAAGEPVARGPTAVLSAKPEATALATDPLPTPPRRVVQISTKTNSSLALTPAAAPQQPNPD